MIVLSTTSLSAESKKEITQNESEVIVLLKEKNLRLEEQNKFLITYTTELRNSYYWALGFAGTFLVLFLGVNIYFLRNKSEEDKERLTAHFDLIINEKTSLILQRVDKKIDDSQRLLHEISDKSVKETTFPINNSISSLTEKIQENKIEILELKLKNHESSGVKGNILSAHFRLAQEVRKLTTSYWDWKVSDSLEEGYKLLEQGVEFDSGELPEITAFLNNLPKQFSDLAHKIRKKLRKD